LAAFLAGGGIMALLSRKVFHRDPCCEAGHDPNPLGWTSFLALSVCSVNDGLLMGFIHPPWFSGLNLGMVFHKLTSSFALALALGHWSHRGSRLLWMGLAHAAISPVFYFLGDWTQGKAEAAMDPMLGFSAGILSYTVLTGMLPHSGQMLKRKPMAWIGFLAALAAALYLGYMHRPFHGG
jgi:zinc transporter ZupT